MGEHPGGQERQAAAAATGRIAGEALQRLGWSEAELANLRKGDVGKATMARRLRKESTMTLKWIAQRLRMGARAW